MRTKTVFFLLCCLPLFGHAFVEKTIQLQGVSITSTASATDPCGVDFLISVSDADQHFVKIDYTYNGTFNAGTNSNPYLGKGSKTGIINISVGNLTYGGMLARSPANSMGLVCNYAWAYQFIASQTNISQGQRDYQDDLKRKEQAKRDEIERRHAEQAERKRQSLQQQEDMKRLQAKARSDQLAAYRNASPENSRCIINDQADIANCERWKAREREEKIRSDAEARRAQQQRDIEARAAADMERASAEGVEKARRDMAANNCAYAAGLPNRIPYPTVNTNNAQYQADIKRIDALNYEAQQKFFRETKAASDACDVRRASQAASQQMQQQQVLQQQKALQIQAEQQKRLQAQQKAQADLNASIQESRKAADNAANDTQKLKNGNAGLMDMINNMK